MNCRDLADLVENRPYGSLAAAELQEAGSHARSCHRCAPAWVVYAGLGGTRVPPMPPELVARCRAQAAARPGGSVLRFAPRGMWVAFGGFAVLAAAAGAITIHFVQPTDETRDQLVAPAPVPVQQPIARNDSTRQGDPDMNTSISIAAAAVALGAAAAAQAQTADPVPEPRIRTATEIIATNDLNRDGIVTREEAAKVNGNLHVMWNDVYDLDLDGRIDVAELERAMAQVQVGTALDKITGESGGRMAAARPETILANNDLDKDGVVTRDEARAAGKALIRMWDSYDLNRDGKVELAELSKAQGY